MQWQEFLGSGQDVPLSPHYLITVAGKISRTDNISVGHSWTNPIFGWQLCFGDAPGIHGGSCPAPMLTRLLLLTEPSQAMHDAAAPFRVGSHLKLDAVGDYPGALAYMAAHPGSAVVLSNAGRKGFAILGVDSDGNGVWFDPNHVGRPIVGPKTLAAGMAEWDGMLQSGLPELGPENFMVLIHQR